MTILLYFHFGSFRNFKHYNLFFIKGTLKSYFPDAWTVPDVEEPDLYNSIKQSIVSDKYIEHALLEKQEQLLADEENPLLVIKNVEMLHPFYMMGAVENNIYNQIKIPMLTLYLGEAQGTARSSSG